MTEHSSPNRPLSPHLSIYRLQLTSLTSILNRITGCGLIISALMIVAWIFAAASGPEIFSYVDGFVRSWLGKAILVPSLWAFWYHLLGGLRHLIWDGGYWLDLEAVPILGWGIIILSVLFTALTLVIV